MKEHFRLSLLNVHQKVILRKQCEAKLQVRFLTSTINIKISNSTYMSHCTHALPYFTPAVVAKVHWLSSSSHTMSLCIELHLHPHQPSHLTHFINSLTFSSFFEVFNGNGSCFEVCSVTGKYDISSLIKLGL